MQRRRPCAPAPAAGPESGMRLRTSRFLRDTPAPGASPRPRHGTARAPLLRNRTARPDCRAGRAWTDGRVAPFPSSLNTSSQSRLLSPPLQKRAAWLGSSARSAPPVGDTTFGRTHGEPALGAAPALPSAVGSEGADVPGQCRACCLRAPGHLRAPSCRRAPSYLLSQDSSVTRATSLSRDTRCPGLSPPRKAAAAPIAGAVAGRCG